jgi:hypothetical protein
VISRLAPKSSLFLFGECLAVFGVVPFGNCKKTNLLNTQYEQGKIFCQVNFRGTFCWSYSKISGRASGAFSRKSQRWVGRKVEKQAEDYTPACRGIHAE